MHWRVERPPLAAIFVSFVFFVVKTVQTTKDTKVGCRIVPGRSAVEYAS